MAKKYQAILPKLTDADLKVNAFFSKVFTKAAENGFLATEVRCGIMRWLIIEAEMKIIPNIGPKRDSVRILVDQEENFKFQVLDVTIDSGKLNEETMKKYLDQMKPKSGYCLCPGVETTYRSLKNSIFRDPTYLRKWPDGTRYDHVDCELWYNPKLMSDKLTKTRCYRCHVVLQSLNHAVKNSKLAEKSCTGTLPKSHTLTYMTPEMRRRTLQRRSEEIRKLRQKVDKYQKYINSLQGKGLISKETDEIMTDIQGPPAINGASCQTAGEICSGTNRNISKLSPDTNTNLSSNSGTCCDYSNISIHSEESSFGGSKRTEDLGLEMSVDSETMNSENDYYTSTDEEDFRTEIDTCIDNNPTDSENILKLYSINNT